MKDQFSELGFKDSQRQAKVIPQKISVEDSSFNRGKILTMPFDESDGIVVKDGYSEIGQLTDSDLSLVIDHVEKSEVISSKQKRKFGIEDKS